MKTKIELKRAKNEPIQVCNLPEHTLAQIVSWSPSSYIGKIVFSIDDTLHSLEMVNCGDDTQYDYWENMKKTFKDDHNFKVRILQPGEIVEIVI